MSTQGKPGTLFRNLDLKSHWELRDGPFVFAWNETDTRPHNEKNGIIRPYWIAECEPGRWNLIE